MHRPHQLLPPSPFAILLGLAITIALLLLVELHIISVAFQKLGVPPHAVTMFLISSLLGSVINIPLARVKSETEVSYRIVSFFGARYKIPQPKEKKGTIVAINLGGAIIPIGLSIYLLISQHLFLDASIGILIVALAVNQLAFRVEGIGIAVPILAPPLISLFTAYIIAPENAAPIAYIAGTLGTLIGADILNLYDLEDLQAPIVSIGGAGTSDGIFLTGIIAVLLA